MRTTYNCRCVRCRRRLVRHPIPESTASILCMDCDSIRRGIYVYSEDRYDDTWDDFDTEDFA